MSGAEDINARAGAYHRQGLAQHLFGWMGNDVLTYQAVQRIVTDTFLTEGADIGAAGGALKTWVDLEVASYQDAAAPSFPKGTSQSWRLHRESVYGLVSQLIEHALGDMQAADWQGLAADLLAEPYQARIHELGAALAPEGANHVTE